MTNRQSSPLADAPAGLHHHDGHMVRVAVGADIRGMRIDWICESCGVAWSEERATDAEEKATDAAATGSISSDNTPVFRRKPDRRKS